MRPRLGAANSNVTANADGRAEPLDASGGGDARQAPAIASHIPFRGPPAVLRPSGIASELERAPRLFPRRAARNQAE